MIHSILIGIFGLGGSELIVIMLIVLLLFGGKKIPEMMKGLGRGVKEFKDASTNPANEPVNEGAKPMEAKL